MFLMIPDEANLGLELFPPVDIPELSGMPPSLFRLSAIPSLDHLQPTRKRTKSTFRRHKGAVLVCNEPSDKRCSRVGIIG